MIFTPVTLESVSDLQSMRREAVHEFADLAAMFITHLRDLNDIGDDIGARRSAGQAISAVLALVETIREPALQEGGQI